jgi:general L-amino acid transport system permease protein
VAVAATAAAIAAVAMQTAENLKLRGIASGFDYLHRAAGFEIASGPLPYSSRDTYAQALVVGVFNTLRVSALGIVAATGLGLIIGVARLSTIRIASTLASAYVEVLRNTPLLLQLFFWYTLSQSLPAPKDALNPFAGVFLCFRGLYMPALTWNDGEPSMEWPELVGFDFSGGTSISPEFAALLIGLTTYTAAFIGEIVRGGILAVDQGQKDAAAALGLSRGRVLRLIVLPQALPVIIPPATSQFLNLVKNSSLAVAIGYPDLISITSVTLNQTGQAIEALTLAMIIYLAISLTISVFMNVYNRTVQRRDQKVLARVQTSRVPPHHRRSALDCRITSLEPPSLKLRRARSASAEASATRPTFAKALVHKH